MMTAEVHSVLQAKAMQERRDRQVADGAREELGKAVRWAVAGGATLREVADAVGLTKGRIQQIVRKGYA